MKKSKFSDDQSLVQAISNGSSDAFRELYDRFYRLMIGVAMNLVKDLDTAKDLVQEVFFQIWKRRENFVISSSLEAYLKRSVINRSLNHIKRNKRWDHMGDSVPLKVESQTPETLMQDGELAQQLSLAIEELPERCKLVFRLKREHGLSHKEISEKLNISTKTVENQMSKALKHLRTTVHQIKNDEV